MSDAFPVGPQVVLSGCAPVSANVTTPCGVWLLNQTLSDPSYSSCADAASGVSYPNTATGFPVYTRLTDAGQRLYGYTYVNETQQSASVLIGGVHCAPADGTPESGVLFASVFADDADAEPFAVVFNRATNWSSVQSGTQYAMLLSNLSPPPPLPPPPPSPPPSPPAPVSPPAPPHPSPPAPVWYANNTVLTCTSIGGLLFLVYAVGFSVLFLWYRVIRVWLHAPRKRRVIEEDK